jgi:DNA-damage-inducible protein D
MNKLQVFTADPSSSLFEKYAYENDITYWLASDLMGFLGYEKMSEFQKPILKAQKVCLNLNISAADNFIKVTNEDGTTDLRLSRFACYLIAMNGDIKKPEVAKAQVYFAALAESCIQYLNQIEGVVRVELRGEITEREKSLSGVTGDSGVEDYALFRNAGYRGMYNMNLNRLRELRGLPYNRSPLDFMGKTELAANLFRITQTEERIKNQGVYGQAKLEETAEYVGREVRETMQRLSNILPEELPVADDIRLAKKRIRKTARQFKKLDRPKKKNIDKDE